MARRPVRSSGPKASAPSTSTTTSSSAHPSTTTSKIEADDIVNKIPIAALTLDTTLVPLARKPPRVPEKPFHFLSLPSELRIKVYAHFFDDGEDVLDLGPDNYKRVHKKLGLMRVCKQIHEEATHLYYSTRTFRIFPTYPGRYFKSKKPLLARLKPNQRDCITSLELRLGPGWSAPPKGWVVNEALGLKNCVNVHRLRVFVECDPSDGFFKGFRRSEGFYENFSRQLLTDVLDAMPVVNVVEFDAFPGVKKSGAMMHGLLDIVTQRKGLLIRWGPERGWVDEEEEEQQLVGPNLNRPFGVDVMGSQGFGSHNFLVGA